MWAINALPLAMLCLAPYALGALMPRQSSSAGCFVCQAYPVTGSPGTASTDPATGDIVCNYERPDHTCTYTAAGVADANTAPGCPTSAISVMYLCPQVADSLLEETDVSVGELQCFYHDDSGDFSCLYDDTGILTNGAADPICPQTVPQCSSDGLMDRRAVRRREDNFTAVRRKAALRMRSRGKAQDPSY